MTSTTSFDVIGETGTIDIDELLAEGAEEDIQEYFFIHAAQQRREMNSTIGSSEMPNAMTPGRLARD